MKVLGLCFGLTLLVFVAPGSADQNPPPDARLSDAAAVAAASTAQGGSGDLALASGGATADVPLVATMAITPASGSDPGDEMFIGTGDGSNGFWVRP